MSDIRLHCPNCQQSLVVDQSGAGENISCPICFHKILIAAPEFPKLPLIQNRWVFAVISIFLSFLWFFFYLMVGVNNPNAGDVLEFIFVNGIFVFCIGLGPLYFLPTIIGLHKPAALKIFVCNFFLGSTCIGWIVALVWALQKPAPKIAPNSHNSFLNRDNLLYAIMAFTGTAFMLWRIAAERAQSIGHPPDKELVNFFIGLFAVIAGVLALLFFITKPPTTPRA